MSLSAFFSVQQKQAFRPRGQSTRKSFDIDGHARSMTVYRGADSPRAAFIVLHGSKGSGESVRAQSGHAFDRLADREACVIAYPDGFENHWNDGRRHARFSAARANVDDVAFLRAIVESLCKQYALRPSSIFLVGFSNGGHLIYRLLADMPAWFGGAVIVGANHSIPGHTLFQPAGLRHPVLLVCGDRDPINPYFGGKTTLFGLGYRGNVLSAEGSAAELARLGSARHASVSAVERFFADEKTACSSIDYHGEEAQVRLLTVHGGGHTIPQPYAQMPLVLGKTAHGFDIARYAWDFFHRASMPASVH